MLKPDRLSSSLVVPVSLLAAFISRDALFVRFLSKKKEEEKGKR